MATRLHIKICGVTQVSDAIGAADGGADAIGLNFHPPSPRCVDVAHVEPILRSLPPFVDPVGVYVNQPVATIADQAGKFGIRIIQWHGDDHPVVDVYPYRMIAAFAVRDVADLERIRLYVARFRDNNLQPPAVLVDGRLEGLYGGTGTTAPWNLLANLALDTPMILAGGLTPENVAEAIRIVRPYGVDVAGGVETSPGRKDIEKIRRFIDNARSICD